MKASGEQQAEQDLSLWLKVLKSPHSAVSVLPQVEWKSDGHLNLGNDIYWKKRAHDRNVQC